MNANAQTRPAAASAAPARPAFGTVLADQMSVANFRDGRWSNAGIKPTGPFEIHPAAHVLHYASTCFEGFKAYRRADGGVHVFRMDKHIERMRQSARLCTCRSPTPRNSRRWSSTSSIATAIRCPMRPARYICVRCCSARCRTSARHRSRRPRRH